MRKRTGALTAVFLLLLLILTGSALMNLHQQPAPPAQETGSVVELPPPQLAGRMSVEEALHTRRSQRAYSAAPLTLAELGQLLWAAQGVTHPNGYRTAASAGALYPLELLVAVGRVSDLEAGIYRYHPDRHALTLIEAGDRRAALSAAALGQESVAEGAVVLAIAAVYERTTVRYGERGRQYVHMEVGIAYQNVHLQAAALGLGTVFIGAFHDDQVHARLRLAAEERPLCLMPIGRLSEERP
jgi:SagB-type dehydrogenase family enzyme